MQNQTKLDPNIEKIISFHMDDVKKGAIGDVANECKDYLRYIHGIEEKKAAKEFQKVIKHLRRLGGVNNNG